MRFFNKEAKARWHRWYAWFPVPLDDQFAGWVWLETVERRLTTYRGWIFRRPENIDRQTEE